MIENPTRVLWEGINSPKGALVALITVGLAILLLLLFHLIKPSNKDGIDEKLQLAEIELHKHKPMGKKQKSC